ncbi:HlyD family efflux transporter periplasmic adaptor subunit [Uliginosibacterium sp. TH139]|uniref:HlyD family efflux transporter periplasmic adaptor subunit n=1 Tax=Uliginosibacterium sp. TH139 TaxID=2067453 RepID=UPI0020B16855|nr:HlyD family efflux transporter periplasmic adaptor subunit [Uliginosibacterium sp. TH139]
MPRTAALPAASHDLPVLREELLLHAAPRNHDGAPAWSLEDPGRAQFFQLGRAEAEMLARWSLGSAQAVAAAVSRETALKLEVDDVQAFARFLQANALVRVQGAQALQGLLAQARRQRDEHWAGKLLKHYLFFRLPLLRPDAMLLRLLPGVRQFFFNRRFALATLLAGGLGLFLVARQWDAFVHTFLHFFTLEGAALSALVLAATKVVHELGHAFAARHHGCRVATMGVAFMVMWPVLYTDTSGAWRLASRRQRMSIGAAGMLAETAIAAWATLAWSFLPDGMLRSAAFMLATTTWLLTLAVNLNPFMRFDGYFLLSDALNVPNLQERAFALARWRLREWLFDLGEPSPEVFAPWRARVLCGYAFAVWVYRFFLFLGIALLVYHFAFKLLGIALFAVEIGVFLVRPIVSELLQWRHRLQQRGKAAWNARSRLTLTLLIILLLLLVLPWRGSVQAPALLRAERQAQLVTPVSAQVGRILVAAGERVAEGRPLFVLQAPELAHELALVQRRIQMLEWQTSFQAMRQAGSASVPVAQSELQAARAREVVLLRQRDALTVRAAFAGQMVDLAAPLREGEWLAAGEWLGTLAAPEAALVEAYVAEADLHRLKVGADASFVAEDPGVAALPLTVREIARTATRRLAGHTELVSAYGGGIAATRVPMGSGETEGGIWMPEQPVYRVLLMPQAGHAGLSRPQVLRGRLSIAAPAESLALAAWRRVLSVLVRESGF